MDIVERRYYFLWNRLVAYTREVEAIEEKLRHNISLEKREKLRYRLNDLRNRLIPQLQQSFSGEFEKFET